MQFFLKMVDFFIELFYAPILDENLSESEKAEALKKHKLYLRWLDWKRRNSTLRLTMEITLVAGQFRYKLDQYQRLNNTRLVRLFLPSGPQLTQSPTAKTIAGAAAYGNGYLTLMDIRSKVVVDKEPIFDYGLGANYFPWDKNYFADKQDIDWTKSYIEYADNTVPLAQNGNSILVTVWFKENF